MLSFQGSVFLFSKLIISYYGSRSQRNNGHYKIYFHVHMYQAVLDKRPDFFYILFWPSWVVHLVARITFIFIKEYIFMAKKDLGNTKWSRWLMFFALVACKRKTFLRPQKVTASWYRFDYILRLYFWNYWNRNTPGTHDHRSTPPRYKNSVCYMQDFHFISFNRTVENGKETVEEWENDILKRRIVDGTLQLTN